MLEMHIILYSDGGWSYFCDPNDAVHHDFWPIPQMKNNVMTTVMLQLPHSPRLEAWLDGLSSLYVLLEYQPEWRGNHYGFAGDSIGLLRLENKTVVAHEDATGDKSLQQDVEEGSSVGSHGSMPSLQSRRYSTR
jgi:hypothetical protein